MVESARCNNVVIPITVTTDKGETFSVPLEAFNEEADKEIQRCCGHTINNENCIGNCTNFCRKHWRFITGVSLLGVFAIGIIISYHIYQKYIVSER